MLTPMPLIWDSVAADTAAVPPAMITCSMPRSANAVAVSGASEAVVVNNIGKWAAYAMGAALSASAKWASSPLTTMAVFFPSSRPMLLLVLSAATRAVS